MFCSNCGKQIPDGSRFCEYCGSPVGGNAPQPDSRPDSVPRANQIPPQYSQVPPGYPQPPKKKFPIIPFVIGVVFLTALITRF